MEADHLLFRPQFCSSGGVVIDEGLDIDDPTSGRWSPEAAGARQQTHSLKSRQGIGRGAARHHGLCLDCLDGGGNAGKCRLGSGEHRASPSVRGLALDPISPCLSNDDETRGQTDVGVTALVHPAASMGGEPVSCPLGDLHGNDSVNRGSEADSPLDIGRPALAGPHRRVVLLPCGREDSDVEGGDDGVWAGVDDHLEASWEDGDCCVPHA